ncbi:MAG: glycosyltransferase family 4 protein [Crocinitomicaceae bacterium]|nr:glycosyltransferase family 4 protein [Crocinitomicaceae bacterium]
MKSFKKKVLWLPKWYPNKFDLLDGVFTVDHAKSAAEYCDIFVLFVHSDSDLKERRKEVYSEVNGYPELTVYFRHRNVGVKAIDKLLIGIKYIRTQFKAYKSVKKIWGQPDITHVHTLLRSSILSLWLKWVKGTPFFVTEHWSGFDPSTKYKIGKIKRAVIRIVLNNAVCSTAVSNYLLKQIKSYAPNARYSIISNAVNEKVFYPRERTQRKKKKIIHISTLDDYPKNFGNILRSIAEVVKVETNFELHVIGKGEERGKQEQLATELGLHNSSVFFRGYLEKEIVAKEIAESDFMILFSSHETQSCVVLEALMCGIPVIVPDLGGVQEIVNEINGAAVTPSSNTDFSEAIISFIREDQKFNSKAILSDALKYGYESIGKQFVELYSKV